VIQNHHHCGQRTKHLDILNQSNGASRLGRFNSCCP